MAVNRGLINVALLNHHAQNQPLLVELHKRVLRLFKKEQEIAQLQRQGQQISKVRKIYFLFFFNVIYLLSPNMEFRLSCLLCMFSWKKSKKYD